MRMKTHPAFKSVAEMLGKAMACWYIYMVTHWKTIWYQSYKCSHRFDIMLLSWIGLWVPPGSMIFLCKTHGVHLRWRTMKGYMISCNDIAQSHCDCSLCVVPFSLLSFCILLLFYVTFVYFMLSMSDNSPCGYCYLLTIPDVKWILSYLILSWSCLDV